VFFGGAGKLERVFGGAGKFLCFFGLGRGS
jgi:hypothetical protein